jgi:fumarate reductase subunit C
VLALCVAVHLATIVYAVQGGLSAGEILARTRGSAGWLAFYAVFVLAAALHAPIGLRAICIEWLHWRGRSRDVFLLLLAALIGWMGMHAAIGVFA